MSILISIEKLLSGNFVEGTRMEFKEGWNPKTIMRSICAFANDFENRGTGIPTMKRVLSRNGSPKPMFDTNEPERSCFVTELTIHPDFIEDEKDGGSIGGSISTSIDNLTDRQKETRNDFGMISERIRNDFGKEVAQTFDIICKKPDLTAKEISKLITKSPRTVENYIAKLKDAGFIERKGAKLGGSWKILDKEE